MSAPAQSPTFRDQYGVDAATSAARIPYTATESPVWPDGKLAPDAVPIHSVAGGRARSMSAFTVSVRMAEPSHAPNPTASGRHVRRRHHHASPTATVNPINTGALPRN